MLDTLETDLKDLKNTRLFLLQIQIRLYSLATLW